MKDKSLRVLIIEDSEDDLLLLIRSLKKGGYNPLYERVETAAAMKKALKEKQWDIILCDYKMPSFSGPSAIALLKESNIDIPLIVVTGAIGEEMAAECMRLGANDYIIKGNLSRLCPAIARELEDAKVRDKQKQVESQKETALEALRESEEKYRNIIEGMQEGYFEDDLAGSFTFINDAMCKFMGYSREKLIGMNNRQYQNEETAKKIFQIFNKIYRTGETAKGIEEEYIRKDGTRGFAELSVSLIRDAEGKPIGFRGVSHDITERKQMEESLRKGEEKYRNILENIEDGYYEIDLDGNLIFFNDSLCRTIGYPKEELMGMNYRQYEDKESLERVFQAYNEVYKTGESIKGLDRQIIRKDGTKRYAEVSISLLKDSSGKSIGFRGIARDVTERKQMEDVISQSEERYRTILDEMDNGYFEVDLVGNYTFINDANSRQLGYSKEEMRGMNFRVPMVKEDIEIVLNAFKNIYITGKSQRSISYRARRKDGSIGFAEISGFPLKNKKGETIGFRGTAVDVTARKRIEEALRQSEEKYRNILATIQEGYFEVDLAGNFTFFNDSICHLYGYSKEQIMGMNYQQYTDKENAKKLFQAFNEVYKTGKPAKGFDWQIIRKNGDKRYIEASAALQKDLSGKPIGFKGIIHDITDRKQIEDALRESEEKYRSILEGMDDVYFEVDLKGDITFVNPSSCKMSGYSEDELLGMSFKEISVTDCIENVMQYFGEIFRTDKTGKPFLWSLVKKNGEQGFFEIIVSLIRDKQGKPIGFRGIGRDVTERKKTEEVLQQTLASLRKAFGTTIQVMVSAVEMRDPYTSGHQIRSADIARAIATEMGLSKEQIDGIRLAASIHDIGKLSVPAEILSKPTKLTDLEFSLIKEHAQVGYEMLKNVESSWPLAQIVYQHHERMNGSGYPRNLKGDEILIEARIMAVADVVESMVSHRPYRPALGIDAALEEIEKNKGILYDDAVVDACLRLFREKNYQIR
jgi:PAS domain S-box-containing protein